MAFREIVAPTVKELFIQQLEGMILSGELRPGDRLPTERELADEMKISKTVVHEGLRELHRLGFLDIASRRGVTVADYAQTGSLETLRAIMDFHGGLPDAKTAGSILQLRYYLEGPAMEELAARTVLPDLPVQLFIILPRIPYLSATIIAIRNLPKFFRICEPVIQSPQILFAQRMYPAVFPD